MGRLRSFHSMLGHGVWARWVSQTPVPSLNTIFCRHAGDSSHRCAGSAIPTRATHGMCRRCHPARQTRRRGTNQSARCASTPAFQEQPVSERSYPRRAPQMPPRPERSGPRRRRHARNEPAHTNQSAPAMCLNGRLCPAVARSAVAERPNSKETYRTKSVRRLREMMPISEARTACACARGAIRGIPTRMRRRTHAVNRTNSATASGTRSCGGHAEELIVSVGRQIFHRQRVAAPTRPQQNRRRRSSRSRGGPSRGRAIIGSCDSERLSPSTSRASRRASARTRLLGARTGRGFGRRRLEADAVSRRPTSAKSDFSSSL